MANHDGPVPQTSPLFSRRSGTSCGLAGPGRSCAKIPSGGDTGGGPGSPGQARGGTDRHRSSRVLDVLVPPSKTFSVQPAHPLREAEFVHCLPVFFISILLGHSEAAHNQRKRAFGEAIVALPCGSSWSACPAVLSLLQCGHSVARASAWGLTGCSQVTVAWAPPQPSWSSAESRALCRRPGALAPGGCLASSWPTEVAFHGAVWDPLFYHEVTARSPSDPRTTRAAAGTSLGHLPWKAGSCAGR